MVQTNTFRGHIANDVDDNDGLDKNNNGNIDTSTSN